MTTVVGAAFARYAREASDYATAAGGSPGPVARAAPIRRRAYSSRPVPSSSPARRITI